MGLFSSEKCAQCCTNSGTSEYGAFSVTDSRIVPTSQVTCEPEKGTLELSNGEHISPHMMVKMGPWYCYWMDMTAPTTHHLCSRKCAAEYAKNNNKLLAHKSHGSVSQSALVFPHQLEIDQYKSENNIGDKGLSSY